MWWVEKKQKTLVLTILNGPFRSNFLFLKSLFTLPSQVQGKNKNHCQFNPIDRPHFSVTLSAILLVTMNTKLKYAMYCQGYQGQ